MADLIQVLDPHVAAERRATNKARIASTSPSADFAIPDARPDNAARAASIASSSSDLPLRRRSWRFGRSTSITTSRRLRRWRASPAPYAPVPATPTRATVPKPASQPCNSAYPAGVVANDSTPNTPPFASTAAATCTPRCVSTPPVIGRVLSTMVIAIPSLSNGQGVARTSREGDRDEPAAANSELGHPPERGVPIPPTCWSTSTQQL